MGAMTLEKQIDHYLIRRHPDDGYHPVWRVWDTSTPEEELVVTCSYLKGAEALVARLLEQEAVISRLLQATISGR